MYVHLFRFDPCVLLRLTFLVYKRKCFMKKSHERTTHSRRNKVRIWLYLIMIKWQFCLFLRKNQCRGDSNEHPQHRFLWRFDKKISSNYHQISSNTQLISSAANMNKIETHTYPYTDHFQMWGKRTSSTHILQMQVKSIELIDKKCKRLYN